MARILVLLRHGEALPAHIDPERGLSPRGIRRVERTAQHIADIARVELIEHSGKRRAEQTAEILAEGLRLEADRVTVRAGIRPEDAPEPIAAELVRAGPDVALVGHLPFLPRLAALLLGSGGVRALEDAEALVFRGDDGRWTLMARVGPDGDAGPE